VADQRTQKELEAFNKKNAKKLEGMAIRLREAGIVRVHYGLDFNNDEPDLGEYAVVEYADGRTEELEAWHPLLDQDVLMWNFPLGSGAYTLDATTARVLEDAQGGLIDVDEAVARAYHTPEQRETLEAEAEAFQEEMDAIMAQLENQDDEGTAG
jgi:hypothetical protein